MGGSVDTSMLDGMVWDDKTQSLVPDPALSQAPAQAAPQAPAPQPTYDLEGTEITDPNIIASMNGEVAPDWHGQASMTEAARILASIGQAPTPENGVTTTGDYRTPPMAEPPQVETPTYNNSTNPNFNSGSTSTPEATQPPAWMQGSIPQWSGSPTPQEPVAQAPSSGGLTPELTTFYNRLVSDRAQGRKDPTGYDWRTDATVPDFAIPKGYSRIPPAGTTTGSSNPQAPYQPPQSRAPMYTPPQWNNTVVPMGPGIPQSGLNGANGHFGKQASMVDLAAGLRNVAANSEGS